MPRIEGDEQDNVSGGWLQAAEQHRALAELARNEDVKEIHRREAHRYATMAASRAEWLRQWGLPTKVPVPNPLGQNDNLKR